MSGLARIALAVFLLLAAALFVERALVNARRVNTDVGRTDQGAYIKNAIKYRDTDYTFVSQRNRMPLYPLFLSLFLREGDTQYTFFERGKLINITLTLVGAALAGIVWLRRFPLHHGLNVLLLTTFTALLFKAPHVQAETLYYFLTFFAFLLCWRLFARPSWPAALAAGVLIGLDHLTKASVLPGLFCFVVFYALDALWKNRPPSTQALKRLALGAVVAVTFVAVIFPYIRKSKEVFGHYFYNVNSTFYFWCESWDDAEARTKSAGDRQGWPDLPPDQIPSASKYLREHSVWDIAVRIGKGLDRVNGSMRNSYGYYGILLVYTLFALGLVIWRRKLAWRLFRRRPMPVLALLAYFAGYFVLVAWYSQIIAGNRFILGLFLPWVFTLSVLIAFLCRGRKLCLAGHTVPLLTAFNSIISVWLAIEILYICVARIPTVYGGG